MFEAKILADSTEVLRRRVTTMELTYPRCIHSEFMTHRMFARNAASSRAIPVHKMLNNIEQDPFVPIVWGSNQAGMQAGDEIRDTREARDLWLDGMRSAVRLARELNAMGLHKQIVNRVTEPWMWITVIVTGPSAAWENFFKLRCHYAAEPHIQKIAYMARDLYDNNQPKNLMPGEWHLPLFGFEGDDLLPEAQRPKVATARCARVSYLTHDGKRDTEADIALHDQLASSGHWSPFEHVAMVSNDPTAQAATCGTLGAGWVQYRKLFVGECCQKAPR